MRALIALSLLTLIACDDADEATPIPADGTVTDAQMTDATAVDMSTIEADMAVTPTDMGTIEADMAVTPTDMGTIEADMAVPALDMGAVDMAIAPDMAPPAPLCADALCFSNRDCPDEATLCLVDPNDDARSCCQPGVRGVDPAGTPCGDDGERTCATAVCISGDSGGRCSGVCDTEEDCPATMQRCFSLGIDGNVEGWCLPTD